MKKTLLSIVAIATLALTGATFASYTGNVVDYYNNNKAVWTLQAPTLWYTSIGTISIYNHATLGRVAEYVEENVICQVGRQMCYSSSTAAKAFGIDVEAFTKWQEAATGNPIIFVNLYDRLYVAPALK